MGKEKYQEYLASPEWKARRERALELAEHKCVLCLSSDHLNVHHNYYGNLGNEADADLVVLCADCHSRHHRDDCAVTSVLIKESTKQEIYNIVESLATWVWGLRNLYGIVLENGKFVGMNMEISSKCRDAATVRVSDAIVGLITDL